jgi:Tfp pilus assembly protein FimT
MKGATMLGSVSRRDSRRKALIARLEKKISQARSEAILQKLNKQLEDAKRNLGKGSSALKVRSSSTPAQHQTISNDAVLQAVRFEESHEFSRQGMADGAALMKAQNKKLKAYGII